MQEPGPQSFGNAENPLTMGNRFKHIRTQPLTELNHPFLIAGGAEMPPFAGKRQQIRMAAIGAADPGKALV